MYKEFRSNKIVIAFSTVMLLLAVFNIIYVTALNILIRLIAFCGVTYFSLLMYTTKIIVNDSGIKIEAIKTIFKSKSLCWNEIEKIREQESFGIKVYTLIPKNPCKETIVFTSGFSRYREILDYIEHQLSLSN